MFEMNGGYTDLPWLYTGLAVSMITGIFILAFLSCSGAPYYSEAAHKGVI